MARAKDHFHHRIYKPIHSTGPIGGLNPTTRYIAPDSKTPETVASDASQTSDRNPRAVYVWSSRNNRKGRHAVAVAPTYQEG